MYSSKFGNVLDLIWIIWPSRSLFRPRGSKSELWISNVVCLFHTIITQQSLILNNLEKKRFNKFSDRKKCGNETFTTRIFRIVYTVYIVFFSSLHFFLFLWNISVSSQNMIILELLVFVRFSAIRAKKKPYLSLPFIPLCSVRLQIRAPIELNWKWKPLFNCNFWSLFYYTFNWIHEINYHFECFFLFSSTVKLRRPPTIFRIMLSYFVHVLSIFIKL